MGCVSVRPRCDAVRLQPPYPDGYLRSVVQRKLCIPLHRASLARGLTTLRNEHKAALRKCGFVGVSVRFCYARNRRMQPASPRRPVPTKPKLAGSGTAEGGSAAGTASREKEASRSDCVAGGGGAIEV
jgi:hypothetical protein